MPNYACMIFGIKTVEYILQTLQLFSSNRIFCLFERNISNNTSENKISIIYFRTEKNILLQCN